MATTTAALLTLCQIMVARKTLVEQDKAARFLEAWLGAMDLNTVDWPVKVRVRVENYAAACREPPSQRQEVQALGRSVAGNQLG